jgi:very-short-patch-repair endonuclease
VRGELGAYDFWLYERGVLVEVDGEQHDFAKRSRHHSKAALVQAQRDAEKEERAVVAGFHVVRLHYAAREKWFAALRQAILEAALRRAPRVHNTRPEALQPLPA